MSLPCLTFFSGFLLHLVWKIRNLYHCLQDLVLLDLSSVCFLTWALTTLLLSTLQPHWSSFNYAGVSSSFPSQSLPLPEMLSHLFFWLPSLLLNVLAWINVSSSEMYLLIPAPSVAKTRVPTTQSQCSPNLLRISCCRIGFCDYLQSTGWKWYITLIWRIYNWVELLHVLSLVYVAESRELHDGRLVRL